MSCSHGYKNRDLCHVCEVIKEIEQAQHRVAWPRSAVRGSGCPRCGGDCKGHVYTFTAKPPNPRGDA